MKSFKERLSNYMRSSYSYLYVQTHEESRVVKEIFQTFTDPKSDFRLVQNIYEWDEVNGLSKMGVDGSESTRNKIAGTDNIKGLMEKIEQLVRANEWQVFILKDFHPYLDKVQTKVLRFLRNLVPLLKARGNMIMFVSPVLKIPTELEKNIQILDFKLPTETELEERLQFIQRASKKDFQITPEVRYNAVEAAKGMTNLEAENAFTLALVENKAFNDDFVKTVFNEKVAQIKKNGFLTYLEPDVSFEQVGGLNGLKQWISLRKKAFLPEAREYGLPYAKGILLCGIPGCGKTLLAKAVSKEMNLPLFQLDVGALFGKLVGETEENFRKLISTVDGVGRCILFIDEIEKALNKDAVSGRGDSGTSSRGFGTLLSWLSDHNTPVFTIGTSNKFTELPPELIRKGRFDELFWIELPTLDERKEIFGVLLKKYKRDPKKFNLDKLAAASEGYTGSEIEMLITSTMFRTFSEGKELSDKAMIAEAKHITPQSKINSAELENMRKEAQGKLKVATDDGSADELSDDFRKIAITND